MPFHPCLVLLLWIGIAPLVTAKKHHGVHMRTERICHFPPDNVSRFHTIEVGSRGAMNHIERHGDLEGSCLMNCNNICNMFQGVIATPHNEGFHCANRVVQVLDDLKGSGYGDLNREFWEEYCVGGPCKTSDIEVTATGTKFQANVNYIGWRNAPSYTKWAFYGNGGGFEIKFTVTNEAPGRWHATLRQLEDGNCPLTLTTSPPSTWGFGVWGDGPAVKPDPNYYYYLSGLGSTGDFAIKVAGDMVTIEKDGSIVLGPVAAEANKPYFFYFGIGWYNAGAYTAKDFELLVHDPTDMFSCTDTIPSDWYVWPCVKN